MSLQAKIKRLSILGSCYSILSKREVEDTILSMASAGAPGYVCVSNVHTTMMGFFEKGYREITNRAALAIPDGMPLVWAMKSMGASSQDRVRGPTLMRDVFERGQVTALKHYLYGGSPEALEKLLAVLHKDYPQAQIVGWESPPFRSIDSISEAEFAQMARRINESGAQVVWVGLGAPKQERWMWAQRANVRGVMLGVGAAFDLLPGLVPEAPALLQSLGLEWLYRFVKEPRRLWRRYLFNNPAFLVLWALQFIHVTLFRAKYLCDSNSS